MTLTFFGGGVPEEPGAILGTYKKVLASEPGASEAVWHLSAPTADLLPRAGTELAARGVTTLTIKLKAVDLSEDQTDVVDEGRVAPMLSRLVRKKPESLALSLELSNGRPYVLPPPSLDISTNDLCGLECVMCSNRNQQRDPLTIPHGTVAALIREAAAWGVGRVALTGSGEPFRDPHMLEHVQLAHSLGLLSTVTTNGLPITDAMAAQLAQVRASISVSIHGASDTLHEHITGIPGSGARAWAGVARLVAARDRTGGSHFTVHVSSVIQRANVSEILALVERSRAAGCNGHNLQPVNLQRGSFDGERVSRQDDVLAMARLWPTADQAADLDRLFDQLVSFREAHGHIHTPVDRLRLFRRYFADTSRENLAVTCRVGETFLAVDHRGRIKPCYRLPWIVPDIAKVSPRLLWNSGRYAKIRRTIEGCSLTCMNNCFFRKH